MKNIFTLLLYSFLSFSIHAEEIKLQQNDLTLNANLEKADSWPDGPTILITHGTLSHNKSEIITALQALFLENDVSTLAINLSLALNDRHGPYDCTIPHRHKHEDAVNEIGSWLNWMKQQGVKQVSLLGHSRGGNQTAWFAAEHDDPVINKVILVAPQTWSPQYAAKSYKSRYAKPLATVLKKAQALVNSGKPVSMLNPVDFIYCKQASASAEAVVSYYATDMRKDTPYLIPQIKKPVLVFAGTEDQVVKELNNKLSPMVQAGKIELDVMDGADHFFRDLYAEDLVDRAVEFITE